MTENEWRQHFSKQVRRKIISNDMTQRELSSKTGITEATISRYIKCKRTPRATDISKIAKALNCTVDELVNF